MLVQAAYAAKEMRIAARLEQTNGVVKQELLVEKQKDNATAKRNVKTTKRNAMEN